MPHSSGGRTGDTGQWPSAATLAWRVTRPPQYPGAVDMSYPQQPSGWTDPSWPADPPVAQPYEQSYDQPYSGTPASPAGYAGYGVPASPPGYPPG